MGLENIKRSLNRELRGRSIFGGTGELCSPERGWGVPGAQRVSGAVTGGYVPKIRVPGRPNIFSHDALAAFI